MTGFNLKKCLTPEITIEQIQLDKCRFLIGLHLHLQVKIEMILFSKEKTQGKIFSNITLILNIFPGAFLNSRAVCQQQYWFWELHLHWKQDRLFLNPFNIISRKLRFSCWDTRKIPEEHVFCAPWERRRAVCEMHLRLVFCSRGGEKRFADECSQPIHLWWMARVAREVWSVLLWHKVHYWTSSALRTRWSYIASGACLFFCPRAACGEDFASLCCVSRTGIF